jgi:hypothetical protein
MSDNTPTQRFDAVPPTSDDGMRKSRLPLILGIIGGVLLIAVIILLVVLLRGKGNPSAAGTTSPFPTASASDSPSPTPSASPTPTPTPAPTHTTAPPPPPPPSNGPAISTWLVNNSTSPVIYCDTSAPVITPIQLSFKWASSNVSKVYFGIGTTDASAGPYFSNLPPSGDNSDFPSGEQEVDYPCPGHSETYTLTVIGAHNAKVSKTVTVLNKGDQS